MAKKVGKKGMADRLPNRKYVTVTWAAATTTAVYTQFDTMMGAREGAGWLISRMDVTPLGPIGPATGAASFGCLTFQLATGAQVAPLAADDDEVIADLKMVGMRDTNGGFVLKWPLTWAGPVLVASRELTCAMDGQIDVAPWQSLAMLFTIWYQWVGLSAREWVEIAEARGIA